MTNMTNYEKGCTTPRWINSGGFVNIFGFGSCSSLPEELTYVEVFAIMRLLLDTKTANSAVLLAPLTTGGAKIPNESEIGVMFAFDDS